MRLLGSLLLISTVAAVPALAGPNRCGTKPPDRSPTWTDALGKHWFDSHGLWTQGPGGLIWGYGGVDFDNPSVQVDATTDHNYQVYLSPSEQCVTVSGDGNAPNIGAYPIKPAPAIVPMPWLHRDGKLFQASDGRTTVLRGVDYPYDQEFLSPPANLTDADMARIASWGMNLLRIRLDPTRDGYYSSHAAEPGYWENLDQIIAMANRHGLYVLLALGGGGALPDQQAYDREKFVRGSRDWNWWLKVETTMFRRYANWPGVIGFDTINEDDSYPPFVQDRMFMGPAHSAIEARLRRTVGDTRHIYFQEPSGWSYWGAEYWPGMMQGNDIGDPNRFYCPKWKPGGNAGSDLDAEGQLAAQSRAPMFMCEMWVDNSNPSTVEAWQRDGQAAMDARLIGGVRTTYPYAQGYGMLNYPSNTEVPWIKDFARPYPDWAGGSIRSIHYDYGARRLVVGLALNGSGYSEVFVGHTGTYPAGFTATTSTGASLTVGAAGRVVHASGMSWNPATKRVVLPPQNGRLTFTLFPALSVTGATSRPLRAVARSARLVATPRVARAGSSLRVTLVNRSALWLESNGCFGWRPAGAIRGVPRDDCHASEVVVAPRSRTALRFRIPPTGRSGRHWLVLAYRSAPSRRSASRGSLAIAYTPVVVRHRAARPDPRDRDAPGGDS